MTPPCGTNSKVVTNVYCPTLLDSREFTQLFFSLMVLKMAQVPSLDQVGVPHRSQVDPKPQFVGASIQQEAAKEKDVITDMLAHLAAN